MTNPNYSTFLGTVTQLQRWRDFLAHLTAYGTFNLVFITIWLVTRGPFWPASHSSDGASDSRSNTTPTP